MRAEVVTITPELAKNWLTLNINNRPVRKSKLNQYVKDIRNGNFFTTNQSIGFFEDGTLADGQHRLLAIVEAGLPVNSLVVWGLTKDSAPHIDTGGARTGSDVLTMFRDVEPRDSKALSGACKMLINFYKGNHWANIGSGNDRDGGMSSVDNKILLDFYDKNKERLEDSVNFVRDSGVLTKGLITKSAQICLHYIFSLKDKELGESYLSKILHGYDVQPNTVEAFVRQFLFDASVSTKANRVSSKCRIYTVVKGFNFLLRDFVPKYPGRVVWKPETDGEAGYFVN